MRAVGELQGFRELLETGTDTHLCFPIYSKNNSKQVKFGLFR